MGLTAASVKLLSASSSAVPPRPQPIPHSLQQRPMLVRDANCEPCRAILPFRSHYRKYTDLNPPRTSIHDADKDQVTFYCVTFSEPKTSLLCNFIRILRVGLLGTAVP